MKKRPRQRQRKSSSSSMFLLEPTTAGLVFRTLTETTRRLENSFLRLTYIAETPGVGDRTEQH